MWKTIIVRKTTDEKLLKCVQEFYRHHPQKARFRMSRDDIVDEIADFYLRTP